MKTPNTSPLQTSFPFASTATKPELRRTGQGAGPLTRLPSVAPDRTSAVPVQPATMEAKVEKGTIQDSLSHDAQYAAWLSAAWLSAAEAAAYLNFKTRTIQLWARQGRLKAYALAGSQRHVWRFLRSDLDEIVMHRKAVLSSAQPSVLANERRCHETSTA
jgi:excisionase family DNA binding protein